MSEMEFSMSELHIPHFYGQPPPAAHRTMHGHGEQGILFCGFLEKTTPRHFSHPEFFSHYATVVVLRGQGTYADWEGVSHPVRAGDCFQRIPGRPHRLEGVCDGSWLECFIAIGEPMYEALSFLGCLRMNEVVFPVTLEDDFLTEFRVLIQKLAVCPQRFLPHCLVRAQELLVRLHMPESRGDGSRAEERLVSRAQKRLSDMDEASLPLPRLAQELGVDYAYMRRVFRKHAGTSPGEYRIQQKIRHACHLLLNRDMGVKEIAAALHYPDPFTFSKQFHRVMGLSPTAFRERL